jgi:hypothetical protein
VPAYVEAAARERFNAPRPEGLSQGAGGQSGRVTTDRTSLTHQPSETKRDEVKQNGV